MPHSTPVFKTELDDAPSALFSFAESSNREPTVSMGEESEYLLRCRWYGEDFFKFSLKVAIFKKAKISATVEDLKVRSESVRGGVDQCADKDAICPAGDGPS